MPLAVAVIGFKRMSKDPSYLSGVDFEQVCECAADEMASSHAKGSSIFIELMPKIPGLSVGVGYKKDDAAVIAGDSINTALNQICTDRKPLPIEQATLNLCNFMSEKLKINRFQAKDILEKL